MKQSFVVGVVSILLAVGSANAAPKFKAAPKVAAAKASEKQEMAVKAAYLKVKLARSALHLSKAQEAKAASLEKKLNAAQKAALARVGARLSAAVHASAKSKKPALTQSVVSAIRNDLKLLGSKDADAVAALALQAAADAESAQLAKSAHATDINLSAAKRLRSSVSEVHDQLEDWGNAKARTVTWVDANGKTHSKKMTKAEAQALLHQLESELQSVSDMTALTQLDLQDAMRTQAQMLQFLSQLSKALHDTAKAIIQNVKA